MLKINVHARGLKAMFTGLNINVLWGLELNSLSMHTLNKININAIPLLNCLEIWYREQN